jgi:hypothetical protein
MEAVMVAAWSDTGWLLRLTRIWLRVAIVCFIVTAILDGRSIYLEVDRHCLITVPGKGTALEIKWGIIYASFMFMLAFINGNSNWGCSRLEDGLNSDEYNASQKFYIFYSPVLTFCVLTIASPVVAALIYWKTATSSDCT